MAHDGDLDGQWLPVTVIVTAWNREASVARAVDSVLAQTCRDVYVVVVDDGSTDGTPSVLARYKGNARVRIVRHAQNRGVTAAKNTGLASLDDRAATFCFLDSDDTLLPDAIASLVSGFAAPGGPYSQVLGWGRDAESGDLTGDSDGGAGSGLARRAGSVTYDDALCGRFSGDFLHLARRDLLGGLRFEERGSGGEASVWWRLLREAPARLVPVVVANIERGGVDRVSVVQYTAQASTRRMWAYQAVLDAVGADMRRACRGRFGELNADVAKWAALAGDRPRARRAARHALRDTPGVRSVALSFLWLVPGRVLRTVASARSRRRASSATAATVAPATETSEG